MKLEKLQKNAVVPNRKAEKVVQLSPEALEKVTGSISIYIFHNPK